jgi:hypothetical protein
MSANVDVSTQISTGDLYTFQENTGSRFAKDKLVNIVSLN